MEGMGLGGGELLGRLFLRGWSDELDHPKDGAEVGGRTGMTEGLLLEL